MKPQNPQYHAVNILASLSTTHNLTDAMQHYFAQHPVNNTALIKQLCFGVCRHYHYLITMLPLLLQKPLKAKEHEVRWLLLLGLYQLLDMHIPEHVAVSETVAACQPLDRLWAKGLINACLRTWLRQRDSILAHPSVVAAAASHPSWLEQELRVAWPQHYQQILAANNQPAPMHLRVNVRRTTVTAYQQQLAERGIVATTSAAAPAALTLQHPLAPTDLPGFEAGFVSVQDTAAQLAAPLLELQSRQSLLDACAAPGGKTCHILEIADSLKCTAIDKKAAGIVKIQQNLARLRLQATVACHDVSDITAWWSGQLFDAILLDAPCSATGVIRRHPDIKLLREPADIRALVTAQQQLLQTCWQLLAPGGLLLYATCSVLPQENSQQLQHFLAQEKSAREEPINADWGHAQPVGRQILPGEAMMDGFYYGRLRKLSLE